MAVIHDGGVCAATTAAFAESQSGKPYAWGASGPDSYDCSGLVWAAYKFAWSKQIGFDPGGRWTTFTIATMGDSIPVGQQLPGDLILPSPEHVGIYVGNGMMINAPTTGIPVREDHLGSIWQVRRLCDPTTTDQIAAMTFVVKAGGIPAAVGQGFQALPPTLDSVMSGLQQVSNQVNAILGAFTSIAKVTTWLADPHNWLRLGEFGMGAVALILGILEAKGAYS